MPEPLFLRHNILSRWTVRVVNARFVDAVAMPSVGVLDFAGLFPGEAAVSALTSNG